MRLPKLLRTWFALAMLLPLTGCAVVAVADLAATVVVTTVKVGVKAVGAVVDAVIPDSDKDKDKEKK